MSSIFGSVDALNPKRSKFNLSHTVDFDCKFGECIPILCEEMVPGDVFSIGNTCRVHFQPTIAPISDLIEVKIDYFFNPYRLLFNEELDGTGNSWEKFITQVPTEYDGVTPTFSVSMSKWHPTNTSKYSYWDYFGFPVGVAPLGKSAPCSAPIRALNLDWNEYYRDENLQEPVSLDNEEMLYSNVGKDYFTSAFLERQRGPVAGLPVNTLIQGSSLNSFVPFTGRLFTSMGIHSDVVKDVNIHFDRSSAVDDFNHSIYRNLDNNDHAISYSRRLVTGGRAQLDTSLGSSGEGNLDLVSDGTLLVSLDSRDVASKLVAQSTAFDISDLRLAYAVQRWQERSLRGGARYTEFLHSFFGVSPRDDRLQRPEYLGGTRSPVIVSDILQTSQTTDDSAQGTESGHLISADSNFVRKYRAVEYGWLVGILRIVPRVKYTNGINRQFLRNTPFEFYFPTFAHLSEQAVYNEEVFAVESEEDNLAVWGYQGIYNEMRYKPNRVCGGLRDDFLYWTMARKFNSLPNLNENFISTKYMQNDFMRIFKITDPNITRPCIVHIFNNIEAWRPMPYLATPQ